MLLVHRKATQKHNQAHNPASCKFQSVKFAFVHKYFGVWEETPEAQREPAQIRG